MAERRPLIQGLKMTPSPPREAEEEFVYGEKPKPAPAPAPEPGLGTVKKIRQVNRVPFTTRIRADLAHAVKQISLERRLQEVEPNQVQEILENALEHWLSVNGYTRSA
jgi:hypothetical protein